MKPIYHLMCVVVVLHSSMGLQSRVAVSMLTMTSFPDLQVRIGQGLYTEVAM